MRSTRSIAALGIVAALSLAGACAGDDDDGVEASVDTTTTAPAASSTTVVVDPPVSTTAPDVDGGPATTTTVVTPPTGGGDPLAATDDDPAPGGLPPISAGTPISITACDEQPDGSVAATVELGNITDLALEASVEVLFEDASARPLATVVGEIERIEPGATGTVTVTSPDDLEADQIDCLLIGLERRELLDGGHQGAEDLPVQSVDG